jgi:hypothetical protein
MPIMEVNHRPLLLSGLCPNFLLGMDIAGTNIIFTNGLKDPWHQLGITDPNRPISSQYVITYEAGHCAPMTMANPHDPPSLTAARAKILSYLKQILNEHQETNFNAIN